MGISAFCCPSLSTNTCELSKMSIPVPNKEDGDHLETHEDNESQPLLISSSPDPHTQSPGRKQEQWQWVTFTSQSDSKLVTPPTPSTNTLLLFSGAIMLSIFAAVSFFAIRRYPSNGAHTGIQFTSPKIQNLWGAYTPYFPVTTYIPPPSQCQITQVRCILL